MNPWQWFCSTRTLSNCLEATLTIIALNYWPWNWLEKDQADADDAASEAPENQDEDYVHVGEGSPRLSEISAVFPMKDRETRPMYSRPTYANDLRICLLCAALACILRPTNILIWISLSCLLFLRTKEYGYFMEMRWTDSPIWINISTLDFLRTKKERHLFVREGVICGYVLCTPNSMQSVSTNPNSPLGSR